jgi:hypothetical protein
LNLAAVRFSRNTPHGTQSGYRRVAIHRIGIKNARLTYTVYLLLFIRNLLRHCRKEQYLHLYLHVRIISLHVLHVRKNIVTSLT